jgi:DNA helicase II / ATP-dependent DNA helicase PcrA
MPSALSELEALHVVPYQEIIALTHYHDGHSPFETKHGVKGAEFENVIVIVGRGWNRYNFNELLELAQDVGRIPPNMQEAFERNRNLFYVACSRPKRRLAVLFTQKLSNRAMQTVHAWFGAEAVEALAI